MYKGISLHIGINKLSTKWYRSAAPLYSPANDAKAMADLAKHEGYDQIDLLINEDATKANFIRHFSQSIRLLDTGDTFLLTFSGHGGQQEDTNGDEIDGKDETWCFYDTCLLDDEIGIMWKEFKRGVRIIVISSSCHSRSSLKPFSIGLPFWKKQNEIKKTSKPVVYVYPDDREILASILHISACDDRQQARDGAPFTRFTELLLKTWDNGRFKGTYEDLVKCIGREEGYLQTSGIAVMGSNKEDLVQSTPFKLLTN